MSSTSGTAAVDYTSDEVINRGLFDSNVRSGAYLPLQPAHVVDIRLFEDKAKAGSGLSLSRMALDAKDSSDIPNWMIEKLPDGTAQVIVNMAALREASQVTPRLQTDIVQHKVRFGRFVQLNESLAANYEEMAASASAAGYSGKPEVFLDKEDWGNQPRIRVMEGDGKRPMVIVNNAAHQMTVEFVKTTMITEAQLQDDLQSGKLRPASEAGMAPSVLDRLDQSVQRLNAKGRSDLVVPAVYLDEGDVDHPNLLQRVNPNIPRAQANMTREGRPFITVNKAFLKMPEEAQSAAIIHELGHIALGHVAPENRFQRNLQTVMATSRKEEFEADTVSACLTGDKLTIALNAIRHASALEKLRKEGVDKPTPEQISATLSGMQERTDGTHPTTAERAAAISRTVQDDQVCRQHNLPAPPTRSGGAQQRLP